MENPGILKETEDYKLVIGTSLWESPHRGDNSYRIINKYTGVCEGEGNILATALRYVDALQSLLDDQRAGFTFAPGDDTQH